MIDFWEMMGRLVTDSKLRKDLFDLQLTDKYHVNEHWRAGIPTGDAYRINKVVNVAGERSFIVIRNAARFDESGAWRYAGTEVNHYDKIRKKVQKHMPNKPLSLMALGSMLHALTMKNFCKLAEEVAELIHYVVKRDHLTLPCDDLFYVALGAMIVDRILKQELIVYDNWDLWGFGCLSQPDRDILKDLLDDNLSAELSQKVDAFCDTGWGQECDVTAIEWEGHVHPVSQLNDGTSVLDDANLQ